MCIPYASSEFMNTFGQQHTDSIDKSFTKRNNTDLICELDQMLMNYLSHNADNVMGKFMLRSYCLKKLYQNKWAS